MRSELGGGAYFEAYPFQGDIAILSEGDVLGYEAAIIRRWASEHVGARPHVDIWTCGTQEAMWGVAYAVGRCRPVLALCDSDFRTPAERIDEGKKRLRDREKRGLRILRWHYWQRNEIENYLLDDAVLLPAFSEVCDLRPEVIRATVAEILPKLVLFQAVDRGLKRLRRAWADRAPDKLVRDFLGGDRRLRPLPAWPSNDGMLVDPEVDAVINALNQATAGESVGSADPETLAQEVRQTFETWMEPNVDSSAWRTEWAGKEVLNYLRRVLAARHGFPVIGRVSWESFRNNDERKTRDREIERAMHRDLVDAFLRDFRDQRLGPDAQEEWSLLAKDLKEASLAE